MIVLEMFLFSRVFIIMFYPRICFEKNQYKKETYF